MDKFKGSWFVMVIAAVFGGIGWLSKDLNMNGVTGAPEPATLGGLTIVGALGLAWTVFSKWKTGGGKADGNLTEKEWDDLVGTLVERLAPQLAPLVDKVAPIVVPAINATVGPTATKLIDDLSKWFGDPTPDANETVLYHKMLDLLTKAVPSSAEGGLDAAAKLREALHALSRPGDHPEAVAVA